MHSHLNWPGLVNARDLGGLPTRAGVMRHGAFVRSDHLNELTDEGAQALQAYGVRTIIDLRYREERAERPGYFEITPDPAIAFVPISLSGETEDAEYPLMHHVGDLLLWNQRQLEHGRRNIAAVMRAINAAPAGGVLFHCHSGKDRTGIIAQLLLLVAGVDESTVVADYMITNERLGPRNEAWLAGVEDPEKREFWRKLAYVQRENVDNNLATFRAAGGAAGFLAQCGLGTDEIASLQHRLEYQQ